MALATAAPMTTTLTLWAAAAAVGLRHGGAVVDTLGELLEGELTVLDRLSVEVLRAFCTIGVLGFLDSIGD